MLTVDAIITALPGLSDADLEAVLEAARREKEARRERERAEVSLTEALDRLSVSLTEAMDRLAQVDPCNPQSLTRSLVLKMLVCPAVPYPLVAAAGFKRKVQCGCGAADETSGWPEVLGVKVWDWPWRPVEPLTRPGREAYIRGFVLSYGPVQKAGLPLTLHLSAGVRPCRCSKNYPRSYSVYVEVNGENIREVSWAAYNRACTLASRDSDDLRAAQEKSAAGVKARR